VIDCHNSEVRDLLPDLLHGSLSSDDRQRVEVHLNECADCRDELDLLSRIFAALPVRVPDAAVVVHSIARYRRRPWLSVPPLIRIAAGVVIVAMGGASYSIVRQADFGANSIGRETTAVIAAVEPASLPLSLGASPIGDASDLNALDEEAMADVLTALENLSTNMPTEPQRILRNPRASGVPE
jgi:predicted anti-sigma-YlaC factor YlaD